jgi:protein-L-isoaspartate(D-aspartate) O-methyltransferase
MINDTYKHQGLRKNLIEVLKNKNITSPEVLRAIGKIPRHFFFEDGFINHAYQDKAFPIGEGQTISQPYTVAVQTELLNLKKGDKILEIGTGSGYQASVLAECGADLYTIERIRSLSISARSKLKSLGYSTIKFFTQDGSKGLEKFAPFDKIIVTAGAPVIPTNLIKQLKINGVLVVPIGNDKIQEMIRFTKSSQKKITKETFGNFSFVPLIGEDAWGK